MNKLTTILFGALLLGVAACKNPSQDIKVVVDMNIMKYSTLLHIGGPNGSTPQNISLAVGGASAKDIYEISGKKVFTVKDGVITLGLGPSAAPAAGADINYNVTISAPGYKTLTQAMSFKAGATEQVMQIVLQKVEDSTPPPVVTPVVVTPTAPTPTATNVSLDFTGYCANRSNLQIRPSLYVFYRVKGSGSAYQYLGYMKDGKLNTTQLTLGKAYDFQITYAGENYNISGTIDKTSYQESFSMGNSICNTF